MSSQIQWKRIIAEGATIVVSILLAFAIDAWWEEAQERQQAQDDLEALYDEFQGLADYLETVSPLYSAIHEQIVFLFSLAGTPDSDIPVAAVDSALRASISAPTFDPGRGRLDALTSSGRIGLIQSPELQAALAAWTSRVADIQGEQLVVRNFVRETLVPYLAAEGVPLSRAYRAMSPERPVSQMTAENAAAVYARVLSDHQFQSLMAYRLEWAEVTVLGYAQAVDHADEVLRLIDEEMQR